MVLAAAEDDDPEFAELKHIVAVDEDHALLLCYN